MASVDVPKLFDVNGLVAVVTGGGTGIGLMITRVLEHNGATVYILGRRAKVLQEAAETNNKHGKIIPIVCDVTDRQSILSAVESIKKDQPYINLLVNNSGVLYKTQDLPDPNDDIATFQRKLWDTGSPDEWSKSFDTNVTAVYYTTVAFLGLLDAGNKRLGAKAIAAGAATSQVISISSIAAFRRDATVNSVSYCASKAAVLHVGKLLSNMLSRWKIRSNVIAPGLYPSEMSSSLRVKIGPNTVPLERAGSEEDMGGLILFLASRAGAYVSGGVHLTDGGRIGLFPATF